ncbi:hypothetical protein BDR26DRAFT_855901 [Obelidium mucronatum]|nr:hypothetical protein BDR26DRAFT_855901 [Obelidium mucronatum]
MIATKTTLAFILAAASMASAHFQLESPLPRNNGGNGKGGPNMAPDTRVNYSSIVNSTILATFYWDGVNDIYLGSGENPQEFPYKLGSFNAKSGKGYKIPIDLSSVPASVLKIICHQPGNIKLYQCADVIYDIASPVPQTQIYNSASAVGAGALAFAAALLV